MCYKSFAEMTSKIQGSEIIKKAAVVKAEDKHTIEAVLMANQDRLIDPILIGNAGKILETLNSFKAADEGIEILDVSNAEKAAEKAAQLAREGSCDLIMKGLIETADLMKVILKKENGLRTERILTHLAFFEVPTYHKILACTDTGLAMYPDLQQKKQIIINAVLSLNKMGYQRPKVGILSAVEKINPKMPESEEAGKLKEMYVAGLFPPCILEGPISYDLAVNKEAAETKGFQSPVAGDVDILVMPNITTGNVLGKALVFSAGAKMAGFITGAKIPIVLTSRASSAQDKYFSILLAVTSS